MKLKILYIVPLLLLFSCGDNARPVELSPETKILYLGNGTEPKDLDLTLLLEFLKVRFLWL